MGPYTIKSKEIIRLDADVILNKRKNVISSCRALPDVGLKTWSKSVFYPNTFTYLNLIIYWSKAIFLQFAVIRNAVSQMHLFKKPKGQCTINMLNSKLVDLYPRASIYTDVCDQS